MKPSASQPRLHVAIILDGNGRWATQKGLPRVAGHRAGAATVRRLVKDAPDCGVDTLTLYAFSSDNWKRPNYEVSALMKLIGDYLRSETARCVSNGVRMSIIGRRDRLSANLLRQVENAEAETRHGEKLHLRVAIDYSGRDMLVYAAQQLQASGEDISRESLARFLSGTPTDPVPDVDLLIRTGGEQRLSDFQLWECAYAELLFLSKMWPDFTKADLNTAVQDFARRDRRFGGLKEMQQQVAVG
ncbi:MAG: di-trans,poly-cis-decaprenylcistransferase [Candidatus Melainabacteria bacterium HGW-Melainabacteria-1]|nr:MAG: di-trans,poly-cis-decaprenylcistransferase [Candidatus Melainabacteria bacterium HGW-Melainabacteria-1]